MNQTLSLSESQEDCLQEVANIAMGQAGDSLARFLEVFVKLSVPRIVMVDSESLLSTLGIAAGLTRSVSAVRQGFYTSDQKSDIRGEAIVVFSEPSFADLAELLSYDQEIDAKAEEELLLDTSNILNGACLGGIADQLNTSLRFSAPSVLGHRIPISEVLSKEHLTWSQALLVEINYALEDKSLKCSLLLLMPGESIEEIKRELDRVIGSLD